MSNQKLTVEDDYSLKLQPGRYVIIDPCYIYPDEEWSDFCDKVEDLESFVATYNGTKFLVFNTAYGDGSYPVYDGAGAEVGSASVDAGLLSVIPYDLFPELATKEELGVVIYIPTEVRARVEDSNLTLGSYYSVITDDSDDTDIDDENPIFGNPYFRDDDDFEDEE